MERSNCRMVPKLCRISPTTLRFRNDDSGMVGMQQSGREDIDLRDISMDAQEGDMFADPVGFCEDNRKPCYHIAEYPLQSQSDTETGDAGPATSGAICTPS